MKDKDKELVKVTLLTRAAATLGILVALVLDRIHREICGSQPLRVEYLQSEGGAE